MFGADLIVLVLPKPASPEFALDIATPRCAL
jgi:hypothetical protein